MLVSSVSFFLAGKDGLHQKTKLNYMIVIFQDWYESGFLYVNDGNEKGF